MQRNTIEDRLLALLEEHHKLNENHPIYGEVTGKLVRAPYKSSDRANGTSWTNYMKNIAKNICKNRIPEEGDCWMIKTAQIVITKQTESGTVSRKVTITRLLAFFNNPTEENWATLQDSEDPTSAPFDHRCGRGLATDPEQKGLVCINGLDHGDFSSRSDNESRKSCKNGASALCPGHGPNKTKCIFTDPEGRLRPCRNNPICVPKCKHEPRCFP